MQPTIHLERKAGYRRGKYPILPFKCIVGCCIIKSEMWPESIGILFLGGNDTAYNSPRILC
jgi:hypothetical protein